MKPKQTITRLTAAFCLLVFVLLSSLQVQAGLHPVKKKQEKAASYEIAALLPGHASTEGPDAKVFKISSDFLLPESGWASSPSLTGGPASRGYFPESRPLHFRLLRSSISINAP